MDRGKPLPVRIKQRHVTTIHESEDGLETVEYVIGGRAPTDRSSHRHALQLNANEGRAIHIPGQHHNAGLAITLPSDLRSSGRIGSIQGRNFDQQISSTHTNNSLRLQNSNPDDILMMPNRNSSRGEDQQRLLLQFWRYIFRPEDPNQDPPALPRSNLQRWRIATRSEDDNRPNTGRSFHRNNRSSYNWVVRPVTSQSNYQDQPAVDNFNTANTPNIHNYHISEESTTHSLGISDDGLRQLHSRYHPMGSHIQDCFYTEPTSTRLLNSTVDNGMVDPNTMLPSYMQNHGIGNHTRSPYSENSDAIYFREYQEPDFSIGMDGHYRTEIGQDAQINDSCQFIDR